MPGFRDGRLKRPSLPERVKLARVESEAFSSNTLAPAMGVLLAES